MTEDVGGANNAFTSDDVTAYHEVVPSNHLETLLWAEAERMSNLNVDEANFKSERAVVEEEYRQRILASPYGRLFNGLIRRRRTCSIPTSGRRSAASPTSRRRRCPTSSPSTPATTGPTTRPWSSAGDFDPKQLDAWVDKYFGRRAAPRRRRCRASTRASRHGRSDRAATVTGAAGAAAGGRLHLARAAR